MEETKALLNIFFSVIYVLYLILLAVFYWNTPLGDIKVGEYVLLFVYAFLIFCGSIVVIVIAIIIIKAME